MKVLVLYQVISDISQKELKRKKSGDKVTNLETYALDS